MEASVIVLADESPNNQLTPIAPDHPAISIPPTSSTTQRISAPSISTRQQQLPSQQLTTSATASTASARVLNPRRRRRSPSPDEQEQAIRAEEEEPKHTVVEDGLRSEVVPGNRQRLREKPSTKRRRLENKTMRLDPDSSTSNGARHQSNGSSLSPARKAGHSYTANGHSSTNGTSSPHKNGTMARAKPSTYYGHDREEVTRLLIQGLEDLGYRDAAHSLSRESGYEVETPSVAAFRYAVLQGEWAEAEALLLGSDGAQDGGGVSISNGDSRHHEGLRFTENADKDELKFRMREQKYLEMLEERDLGGALMVLRQELKPLNQDTSKLHELSRWEHPLVGEGLAMDDNTDIKCSLIVCESAEDLRAQARWDGALGASRHHLLEELSSMSLISAECNR